MLGITLGRVRRLLYDRQETSVSEAECLGLLARSLPALRARRLEGQAQLARLDGLIAACERALAGDEGGIAALEAAISAPAPGAVRFGRPSPGGEG